MKRFDWNLESIIKPKNSLKPAFDRITGVNYQKKLQDCNEEFNSILTRVETELPKLNKIIDQLVTDIICKEKFVIKLVPHEYLKIKDVSLANVFEGSSLDIDNRVIYINGNSTCFYHTYNLIYQLCVIQEIKNNASAQDKNSDKKIDHDKAKVKFLEIMLDYWQDNMNDQNDEVQHITHGGSSSEKMYDEFCTTFVENPIFRETIQNSIDKEEDTLVDVGHYLGEISIEKKYSFAKDAHYQELSAVSDLIKGKESESSNQDLMSAIINPINEEVTIVGAEVIEEKEGIDQV